MITINQNEQRKKETNDKILEIWKKHKLVVNQEKIEKLTNSVFLSPFFLQFENDANKLFSKKAWTTIKNDMQDLYDSFGQPFNAETYVKYRDLEPDIDLEQFEKLIAKTFLEKDVESLNESLDYLCDEQQKILKEDFLIMNGQQSLNNLTELLSKENQSYFSEIKSFIEVSDTSQYDKANEKNELTILKDIESIPKMSLTKPVSSSNMNIETEKKLRNKPNVLKVKLYSLIENFEDIAEESSFFKNKINTEAAAELASLLPENFKVYGFYGDFDKSLKKIENLFNVEVVNVNYSEQENNKISFAACIIEDIVALIVKCHNDVFSQPFYKTNQIIDYLRFLMDFANLIVLSVPENLNIIQGEPAEHKIKDGESIFNAILNQRNDALIIKKINIQGDLTNFVLKENFSPKFVRYHCWKNEEKKMKYVIKASYYGYGRNKQYTFDEIKQESKRDILFQDTEHIYQHLYKNFLSFVDENKTKEFERELSNFVNDHNNVKTINSFWKESNLSLHSIFVEDDSRYELDVKTLEIFFEILKKPLFITDANPLYSVSIVSSKQELLKLILKIFYDLIEKFFEKFENDFIGLLNDQLNTYVFDYIFYGMDVNGITIRENPSFILPLSELDKFFSQFQIEKLILAWWDRESYKHFKTKFISKKDYNSVKDIYEFLIGGIETFKKIVQKSFNLKMEEIVYSSNNQKKKLWKQKLDSDRYFYTIEKDENYALEFQTIQQFLEKHCSSYTIQTSTNLKINFSKLALVKETDGNIRSANISAEIPFIQERFLNCSKSDVSDFYPLDEYTGYIVLKFYPSNNSVLYFYNLFPTPKMDYRQSFSHLDARLVLNIKSFIYIIYTNSEKRFQFGRLSKNYSLNIGRPIIIYDNKCSLINYIESICILSGNESILILDEKGSLHEFIHASNSLKTINVYNNPSSKKINDEIPAEIKYQRVNCSYNGKLIYFQSLKSIDIFDTNYQKLKSLPINEFKGWNSFANGVFDYLIIIDGSQTECYQFTGVDSTMDLNFSTFEENKNESGVRNPILEYLYIAKKKYGSPVQMLGCPETNSLLIESSSHTFELLVNYFKLLKFKNMSIAFNFDERFVMEWAKSNFVYALYSRIPIHIASIQNYNLVPFNDGKYDFQNYISLINQNNKKISKIELLSQNIRFGHYEDLITKWSGPIHIISIVGKQSSGKSYILNRLFGTRFNVAGTRCTDGIWMSTAFINNEGRSMLLIILDCEGLFSIVRNNSEEMKLCLALAAVSDVFIVNQDLSFNRHLNSLMTNLTSSIGRLEGSQLFKGCVAFFVRDVAETEFGDAKKEYESNMKTIYNNPHNFIAKLFNNQSIQFSLTYFEQESFENRLKAVKNGLFKMLNQLRWPHGEDFIFSFKIVLSQIMIDDDMKLDDHKTKIIMDRKINFLKDLYYKYDMKECLVQTECLEDESTNPKFDHTQIEIERTGFCDDFFNQIKNSASNANLDINNLLETFPYKKLLNYVLTICASYNKVTHDSWISEFISILKKFFEDREKLIIQEFNKQFDGEAIENKQSILRDLKLFFEDNRKKAELCDKLCRKCRRKCFNFKFHEVDCDCQTDHECDQACILTENCKLSNFICGRDFGHEGEHSCKKEIHKCPEKCKIESCEFFCMLPVNHPEDQNHNCNNRHICPQQCKQNNCNKCCVIGIENPHTEHFCGNQKCCYTCKFCSRTCNEENHFHQEELSKQKSELTCTNHHNCGHEHNCLNECQEEGVCNTDFQEIEKEIWTGLSYIKYTYFKPFEKKNKCTKILKPKEENHIEKCACKVEIHKCPEVCPECGSFCSLPIGHNGLHFTNNHRNKEFCRFVSLSNENQITIGGRESRKIYKVGDRCEPEICNESCKRKFRSHYHLKECPGNDMCPSIINPKIIHSSEQFHPFPDKVYDKFLCEDYWKSYHWKVPVSDEIAMINKLCSFYCPSCPTNPDGIPSQFCIKEALHAGNHELDCDHASNNTYQIAFCCDTTGSMSLYLEQSKETVSNIISSFTSNSSKAKVEFAFVAYRDHPPQDSTYVTKTHNFCDESTIKDFISTLDADGGGDTAEAVLDGINDSVNKLSWNEKANKYIFLISDAPPHGREYTSPVGLSLKEIKKDLPLKIFDDSEIDDLFSKVLTELEKISLFEFKVSDKFPEGCPCGLKIDELSNAINKKNIQFKLMKIGSIVNKMDEIFKTHITNYQSFPINDHNDMDFKITSILVEDLKNNEIDVIEKY